MHDSGHTHARRRGFTAAASTSTTMGTYIVATSLVAALAAGAFASDCCFDNGSPGCDDATCEAAVCALDSFCCAVEWDSLCAGIAATECATLCGAPPPPPECNPGAGDCCGANGTVGCDDEACCTLICGLDPFCCSTEWDGLCAADAEANCAVCAVAPACGVAGTGDCCTANGSPYCDDEACCDLVCANDPFCCNSEWDGLCATDAQAICAVCDPPTDCGDAFAGDCLTANGTPYCDCAPCCELICAGDPFCCSTNWDGLCASAAVAQCTGPVLTLVADDSCLDGSGSVFVTVELVNLGCDLAAGFQAFIEFDDSSLGFIGGSYTATPFGLPVLDPIVAVGGTIDLAAGIDQFNGQAPFDGSATLATLEFAPIVADDCAGSSVAFRPAFPPTRLTFLGGGEIPGLVTVDSDLIVIDTLDPVWTFLPGDISVAADAGFCAAIVAIDPAVAADNCSVTVTGVRSDSLPLGDPYPSGTTTITWTAVDPCGNSITHEQEVEVLGASELLLTVELAGMIAPGPFTRCIDLELFGCPATLVSTDVTFSGGIGTATILVPCTPDPYDCATAGDPLHTLRSTTGVSVSGTQFVADFVGAAALLGGNADGNEYIDILDFGVFALQFNSIVGADTDCTTSGPHADFSGDGIVDLSDFTFIQQNFLAFDQPGCGCPSPMVGQAERGMIVNRSTPIERISVRELHRIGRGELAAADLNGDGWLDAEDIVHFLLRAME